MKRTSYLPMTLLAVSIANLAACGGGGGGGEPTGGTPDNNLSTNITRENAQTIAQRVLKGKSVGEDSKKTTKGNASAKASVAKATLSSSSGDSTDDSDDYPEYDDSAGDDDTDDYSDDAGAYEDGDDESSSDSNIEFTQDCGTSGTSYTKLTLDPSNETQLYKYAGPLRLTECRFSGDDYTLDGEFSSAYYYDKDYNFVKFELTGAYTSTFDDGKKLVKSDYSEAASYSIESYNTAFSYVGSGSYFDDATYKIFTTEDLVYPVDGDDYASDPMAGVMRIEDKDGSYLILRISSDGHGVYLSTNGEEEEFKSWKELEDSVLTGDEDSSDDQEDDDSDDSNGSSDSAEDDSEDDADDSDSDDDGDSSDDEDDSYDDDDTYGDDDSSDDESNDEDDSSSDDVSQFVGKSYYLVSSDYEFALYFVDSTSFQVQFDNDSSEDGEYSFRDGELSLDDYFFIDMNSDYSSTKGFVGCTFEDLSPSECPPDQVVHLFNNQSDADSFVASQK